MIISFSLTKINIILATTEEEVNFTFWLKKKKCHIQMLILNLANKINGERNKAMVAEQ